MNNFDASKINNPVVRQHAERFAAAIPDIEAMALSFREAVQAVIVDAVMAKAEDTDGEVGCRLMSEFMTRIGGTRAINITAVQNYMLWVFCDGPIQYDKDNKPVLDASASAIRWNMKKGKFETAKEKADGETLLDPNGEPYKKGKLIAKSFNVMSVKARLAAQSWYDFNPAKPEKPYKGKAVNAIKSDLKKLAEGQYIPEDNMKEFLDRVKSLAFDCGISLD
jgi:hypothetical protein